MLWIYGGHAGHAIRANTEIVQPEPPHCSQRCRFLKPVGSAVQAPSPISAPGFRRRALTADVIEPEGHFDDAAVLPFQETDYVSRELRNEARG